MGWDAIVALAFHVHVSTQALPRLCTFVLQHARIHTFTLHWSVPLVVHTHSFSDRSTSCGAHDFPGFDVAPPASSRQPPLVIILLCPRKYDALAIPLQWPAQTHSTQPPRYNARLAWSALTRLLYALKLTPLPLHARIHSTFYQTRPHPSKLVDAPKMVAREVHPPTYTPTDPALEKDGIIYEYGSAANPTVSPIPYLALGSSHHEEGKLLRRRRRVCMRGRGEGGGGG